MSDAAAIYPAGGAGVVLINVFLKRNHAYSPVSMFNARASAFSGRIMDI